MKAFILLILFVSFNLASKERVSIGTLDYCPYHCKSTNSGYVVDIVKEIYHNADIYYLPWKRAVINTVNGDLDALLTPTKSEAPLLIYPVETIGIQRSCFFVLDENKDMTIDELSKFKVGTFTGYSLDGIQTDKDNINYLSGVDALSRGVKMLKKGRIKSFFIEENGMRFYLKKNEINGITTSSCTRGEDLYVGFNPKDKASSTALSKELSEGVIELRRNGKLDQILSKYGLLDWK
ncbi:transporter substrate-binding domain-containing protein [Vibrio sp. S4M6]|uniref:substrate-binding periplasmic protein n=1 Tax=Vibrio sinus TaxID=2946865 RepID=UPI002029D5CA|nr:transporter substrate-binding domain-containing protein [Vibrio sinus]MCL9781607.1 transporter substrate-binding domain-containing protein [Vibrio sinus]